MKTERVNFDHPDYREEVRRIIQEIDRQSRKFSTDQRVREFAVALTIGQVEADEQANTLFDFVLHEVAYVPDPLDIEYILTPDVLLDSLNANDFAAGDCDDLVLLLNSLAKSIGIPAVAVSVKGNSDRFDHVISGLYFQDDWHFFDPANKERRQKTYTEILTA